MTTSISSALHPCLKTFNHIQHQAEQPGYACQDEVSAVSWADELGRLRIWAANIGAHQTGQSSLEFRLRDSSHISRQVIELLGDLNRVLDDVVDELSEGKAKASEEPSNSGSEPDESSASELQQLHEEVVNVIDCLYQLSMLIRKPAHHDLWVGSYKSDAAAFEPFDREHVRNKYPNADNVITQRLGHAITQRRRYLKYRDRHHAKLGKGLEDIQGIQRTSTESAMSETIATDFQTGNIDFEEDSSNSGVSQTSYALSLLDGGPMTVPSLPKGTAAGKPFECPYCYFLIDIKGTRSWTRHIFKDIKPYVCPFHNCNKPEKLYESRREWFAHVAANHQTDLHSLACPLCPASLQSFKFLERHIARHLEELALFALPRTEMDDEGEVESASGKSYVVSPTPLEIQDSESSEDDVEEKPWQLRTKGDKGLLGLVSSQFERYWKPQCISLMESPSHDVKTRSSEITRLIDGIKNDTLLRYRKLGSLSSRELNADKEGLVKETEAWLQELYQTQKRLVTYDERDQSDQTKSIKSEQRHDQSHVRQQDRTVFDSSQERALNQTAGQLTHAKLGEVDPLEMWRTAHWIGR